MVSIKRLGVFVTLFRFVKWIVVTDPRRALISIGLNMLQGVFPAIQIYMASRIFGQMMHVYDGTSGVRPLLEWIAAWASISLLSTLLRPVEALYTERIRQEMEDSLLRQLQNKAARLRLEAFERSDFQDLLTRARRIAGPGQFLNLLWEFYRMLTAVVRMVSIALLVGTWNVWLLLALVIVALPEPIAGFIQAKSAFFLKRKQTEPERVMSYLAGTLTSRAAAKEVRTFDASPWLLRRWETLYRGVADTLYRQERAQQYTRAGLSGVGMLGLAAGAGWTAWTVAEGSLSAAGFGAMLFALQSMQDGMQQIVGRLGFFRDRLLQIEDLFIYVDLQPEEPVGGEAADSSGLGDIRVEQLTYRYPQSDRDSLSGISFTLREGERIALVGSNGSGKTTLVKVLLGLYEPSGGSVCYGGRSLAQLDLKRLRDRSAAVFQDFTRYAFTLRDNVGLGRAERIGDERAIREASALGGADEVAGALSDGFETMLTRQFTGGTDLSGGQWQRVAISRAFMRDAPLVVLDEPTAALDPKAETDVFERFAAMAGSRTAVLVSHRLGMARLCDRVMVMQGGRLIELGTHDELLAAGGEYARLWSLQSQWYRESVIPARP
ncbi:ABC transporter ATP-binding protein [Paenibacillus hemerocallicola]|uniref:ABC transporter ATP-binding protein n=1 Tax=Paenibacillus hemerocallicola TaxID=1172614 RepID=A0A5C4T5R0_9BACL|nr:ABC transporter ATP-binding protein [Paenibacillus hemerocallicola]TNJ64403.1 ABC transporter ATP-binding protein [Paenibacillus hemerocallicola]